MKKKYMKPEMAQEIVNVEHTIMAGSNEGVTSGSKTGDEYSESDVTYGNSNGSLWDED